ncbi:MAG: bifunctional heptose 7-phosphate kinase/heptose 1-phosphate adenyltransferase [Legionellales bacterium]|mgnify:CR=1 FL=1|nr:bifunctional heptose 7-phosphate kinase/heptose 1-phosphate adenyltransferase [Legionellales bacterium]|tara:strand:- start:9204 stop:10646 length:1443 start_codon:yes stop_codon:yes gene_type:complete
MTTLVPDFSRARVLVYGDVMLDRYWYGNTGRISPEAPVPVVHIRDIEERPGGAGNVALNITALGAQASLFSVCGDDAAGRSLDAKLTDGRIAKHILKSSQIPTVAKLRVVSTQQQLIRLDFEEPHDVIDTSALMAECIQEMTTAGALILSDYGKGTLTDIQGLIQAARERKVPVLIDPKTNDFSVYRGASVITPNLKEFEAVVGRCPDEETIITKGLALMAEHDISALLVTRGEKGMTLLQKDHPPFHQPTKAQEVYDVTGAGDTVIGVLAAGLAAGETLQHSVTLANAAAGIVVGKLGTATAELYELKEALLGEQIDDKGVLGEDKLAAIVRQAQEQGKRIVMTNGCFDILHPGHVAYLEEAKALGDLLIVAMNDDASVKRLKGPQRPINPLENRMAVLAGLGAVDWVVPFTEDTPERIIGHILPDILVKGGDWQVDQIAGSEHVLANGGEVLSLQYIDGLSTTDIVEQILSKEADPVC